MKKTKKILSIVLVAIFVIGLFSGCSDSSLPRELGKYSYWVTLPSSNAQTMKSFDELLMYQEMQKRTGIEIEFIHPVSGSSGNEAFQILLSSNDMPDIVEYTWASYPGGPEKAIQDNVIISLNKYLQDSAPNYYSYMEGEKSKDNPLYRVQSITLNGNYYGFKNMKIGTYRTFSGLYIRKDMLDKWGLEVPVTIDDWTNVFKTAKENGVDKPFTSTAAVFAINNSNAFNSAWNVSKDYYIDNGEIKFAPEQPGFKSYVAQMAEWFKAGYIDPDYLSNDSEIVQANMTNGSSIATYGAVGGGMGKLYGAMESRDPNYNLVACPTPVINVGDVPWFVSGIQSESDDPTIAISVACGAKNEERYKEAMKFCDYLYSDEGNILKCFGVEGETFETIQVETDEVIIGSDGSTTKGTRTKYVYTDKILDPDERQKYNAQSVEAALYHFFRPANSPGLNQHNDYLDGYYPYQQQKDALVIWNQYVEEARKHIIPTAISYEQDEINVINQLNAQNCTTNLDADINDIIMGKKSVDEFDSCVEKAKNDGCGEILKIRQKAYDRYLSMING